MDCESSTLTTRPLLHKGDFHKGAFIIAHIRGLYLMWYLINLKITFTKSSASLKNSTSPCSPCRKGGRTLWSSFSFLVVMFVITDLDMMYLLRKIFLPSEVLEVCIYSHLQCFLRGKIPPVRGWEILGGGNMTQSDSDHLNLLESWKQYSVYK